MNTIEYDKLRPFFDVFRAESDRACGVLAGALLDSLLEKLLRKAMLPSTPNEIFKAQGPLGTFSAKIDMSFYMGLISKEDHIDLHIVRKVRNDFAHAIDYDLGFDKPPVSDRIRSLRLPKILFEHPTLQVSSDTLRERFQIGVGILWYLLSGMRYSDVSEPKQIQDFTDFVSAA